MTDLKQTLDALDPRLWWLSITIGIYLLVFVWKKLSAKLPEAIRFDQIPTRLKVLPALALALVLGATGLESAEIGRNVLEMLLGVISGVTAIGAHETLQRLGGASAPRPDKE